MSRKWDRKMILSSVLLVLIFIRHTIATYENDYKPRWNGINQNQQHVLTPHQVLHQIPHHQHRHHHESTVQNNNREMHIKSKHNETNNGTMVQVKNRSANSNRSYILPNRVNMNSFDAPTSTLKAEYNPRSAWFRNNRQSHQEHQQHNERSSQSNQRKLIEKTSRIDYVHPGKISHEDQWLKSKDEYDEEYDNSQSHQENHQQHKENSLQPQNNQTKSVEKKYKIDNVDPGKISHEDQGLKSKDEYDEDYDENYYYEEVDENENAIEVRRNDNETDGRISDQFLDKLDSHSRKEEVKSEEEPDYMFGGENSRQDVGNFYNSEEYLNDEANDDQNQDMSLTDIKLRDYGTRDAVSEQFMKYQVNENEQRLKREGRCHLPHPKVIQVIEASDRFVPHCTILHRCADDTGCCIDDKKTCAPKTYNQVKLYFYITPFGKKTTIIDFRMFENHTECHCVERSRFRRASRQNSFATGPNIPTSNETCRCPSHFRVIKDRTQCRCDCLSWNQKCYDLKEGKDQFPYKDQKCISENKCVKPSCDYGHYNKHSGRCPKLSKASSRKNYRYLSDLESTIFNGPS